MEEGFGAVEVLVSTHLLNVSGHPPDSTTPTAGVHENHAFGINSQQSSLSISKEFGHGVFPEADERLP